MLSFITGITLDPVIRPDVVEREKPAVIAEMRPRLGQPSSAFILASAQDMYTCNAMKESADVKCHLDRLSELTTKNLERLYKRAYVRSAMLFVLAGPFTRAQGVAAFRGALTGLGALPPMGRLSRLCSVQPPRFMFQKSKDKVARISLSFHCTLPVQSPLLSLFGFFTSLLTGGITSFLYSVLRTRLKRVYKVSCFAEEVGNEVLVWISTSCTPKDAAVTLEALVAALQTARDGGIPEPLIETSKQRAIFSIQSGCWTSPVHAARFYAPQFLISGRNLITPAQLVKRIRRLTHKEVTRLLNAMMPVDRCSITYGAPTRPNTTLRRALHL